MHWFPVYEKSDSVPTEPDLDARRLYGLCSLSLEVLKKGCLGIAINEIERVISGLSQGKLTELFEWHTE